jgi:hypothetical protein
MGNMLFGMQTWASKESGWIGSKSQASLIQNLMHILDTEEEWFPVKGDLCGSDFIQQAVSETFNI